MQPQVMFQTQRRSPNIILRLIYFVFIGWWASGLWMSLAWFFVVLIFTMPLGLVMVNKIPLIATLKAPSHEYLVAMQGAVMRIQEQSKRQIAWILRALYFIFIGWWASGLWMGLAWLLGLTIVGLPLTIWMYDRVPAITTLRRY